MLIYEERIFRNIYVIDNKTLVFQNCLLCVNGNSDRTSINYLFGCFLISSIIISDCCLCCSIKAIMWFCIAAN